MRRALITGGTSGIGLAFARALARQGSAVVLVARDASRLESVASELRAAHGVEVSTMVADLASRDDQGRVAERLAEGDVDVLVNNAGFSLKASLIGIDPRIDVAYEVMGRATRVLAGAAAAAMVARGSGHIITVSSVSALTRQDSYSALKAYALALTEVLAAELVGTGVTATAVLPGWTRTEFHARGGQGRSAIPDFLWLDADRVAEEGLRDALAGKVVSIPARRYKVIGAILEVLPSGAVRAVSRALSRRRKRDRNTAPVEGESR